MGRKIIVYFVIFTATFINFWLAWYYFINYNKSLVPYLTNPINNTIQKQTNVGDANETRLFYAKQNEFNQFVNKYCSVQFYNLTHECLEKLSQFNVEQMGVPRNLTEKFLYHTYWHHIFKNEFQLKIMFMGIYSYLATQDLNYTKLIIWSIKKINEQKVYKELKSYIENGFIEFRILNTQELCDVDPFKMIYKICNKQRMERVVSSSDFARYLVLYNYGGIYFDGDTILLRDLRPFWNKNFAYRWEKIYTYNNALIGFTKEKHENIEKIFYTMIVRRKVNDTREFMEYVKINGFNAPYHASNFADVVFFAHKLADAVSLLNNGSIFDYPNFEVYHSALFDTAWLCSEGPIKMGPNIPICLFRDFFVKTFNDSSIINNFFHGAFSYHLHHSNCGPCVMIENTMFFFFSNYFKNVSEAKLKKYIN